MVYLGSGKTSSVLLSVNHPTKAAQCAFVGDGGDKVHHPIVIAGNGEPRARVVRLDGADDVAIAVDALEIGDVTPFGAAVAAIPKGHKIATNAVAAGSPVRKFGQVIGFASAAIGVGEHVHSHNLELRDFVRLPGRMGDAGSAAGSTATTRFEGFRRADGRVGTRNHIGILTTVNCSATVARAIAAKASSADILGRFDHVDSVAAFVHGTGCGMAGSGAGFDNLARTLAGYATHSNFAGVLIVGLGCEVAQISTVMAQHGLAGGATLRTLVIQDAGGTRATIAAGVAAVTEMLEDANRARRETVGAEALTLALQCGGSDGYSGITANPALGIASDLLVAAGGSVILTETTEIYGAEHLLMARAASPEIAERLGALIGWWEEHTRRHGETIDNNPTPGNKAGGLTTILEKSLGAVAKAGGSPLNAVYRYAERVRTPGLVFMDAPGFDPVSATGQIAAGANILCFTTGRGSAFGAKPTPVIKLSTNSDLYRRMPEDIDLDCGDILDGVSIEEKGRQIFDLILRVASGARTVSEDLGYGDAEFVPWQLGATV